MVAKKLKLNEAFDLYVESEVTSAGLSINTANNYANSKNLAIRFFGNIPVRYLTDKSVRSYYKWLVIGHAPKTTQGHIVMIRTILKFCMRKKIKVMDYEDIKIPKVKSKPVKYLTEDEFNLFFRIVSQPRRGYSRLNRRRNMALVHLLYKSGVRNSELCRMDRGDIKNRQFIVVGKSLNPRPAFVTKQTDFLIKEYLKLRTDNSPALFIANQTGQRITPQIVQKIFRTVCTNSDFRGVHPHTMRHSCATNMLEKGVDIRYIGEFLGHESLETTKIYTHVSNPNLRKIYEKIHK